jgi:tetratricopeptide (TPR) repeat protein
MAPRRRGRWYSSIAVASWVLTLLVSGCAESPESPEVLVARGHLMESRGKLDDAVAFGRLGRWDDAVADYTRAIEQDPGMARAYNNRAAAYAQERRFDAAVADFSKTIQLDSKSALAYRNRGLAYHDLGQIAPSIEDYSVAIRLDPNDFESRFERGNVYLDAADYQKAVADYDQAIALDAKRASAWLNRAEAHRRLGHAKQSLADIAEAHRLDPNQKPTELAHAAPEKALLPPSVTSSDVSLRQERAVAVAADFLKSRGYEVERSGAVDLFPLVVRREKADQKILVRVQSPPDGEPLRFTRDDLDQIAHRSEPTALVVVGKMTSPDVPGQPFTGGTVIKFVENWKAVRDKLVPVVFEFPLRDLQ